MSPPSLIFNIVSSRDSVSSRPLKQEDASFATKYPKRDGLDKILCRRHSKSAIFSHLHEKRIHPDFASGQNKNFTPLQTPGPADYYLPVTSMESLRKIKMSASFQGAKRLTKKVVSPRKKGQEPGPGHYEVPDMMQRRSSQDFGVSSNFQRGTGHQAPTKLEPSLVEKDLQEKVGPARVIA